jgi:integrase
MSTAEVPQDDPAHHDAATPNERERIGEHVTIYRIPDSPCWYIQFNKLGRQYRYSLRTRSKKRAVQIARRKDAELILNTPTATEVPRSATTVLAAAARYLASQRRHVSTVTLEGYARDVDQFTRFVESKGIHRLDALTSALLEEYEQVLRESGPPRPPTSPRSDGRPPRLRGYRGAVSSRSIHNKLKSVRQMIKWAVRRRLVSHDPVPDYRLPPMPDSRPRPFTPQELSAILSKAAPPFRDILDFLRLTGLRSGELCWLMKDDIDRDLRFVRVRKKTCPLTGRTWQPKHGRDRLVPLCPPAAAIADRQRHAHDEPWLFPAPRPVVKTAGRLERGQINYALQVARRAAGVTHGRVHALRHTYCSFVANAGVPAFLVMRYMGHANLRTLLNYYHAGEEELLGGIQYIDFDRMLSENGPKALPADQTNKTAANTVSGKT